MHGSGGSDRYKARRTRTILLCFLAQNLAMGIAFGSFGPLLPANEAHFAITAAVAATGMSVITFAQGLLAPLLGGLLHRTSVKGAMIVGALLSAAGYWGIALLGSFIPALVMYAFIGAGVVLTAVLGPLILVTRWVTIGRGKVLSFVCLPLVLFLCPYIAAILLERFGRAAILGGAGSLFLLLAPLLLLLDEGPREGQLTEYEAAAHDTTGAPTTAAGILSFPPFWLLSIGAGIMAGVGVAYMVHIVPFGLAKGMTLPNASALLSVYAGSGIFGTLLFGWIIDRIGPAATLLLAVLCQTSLWTCLAIGPSALYFGVVALLGICTVPFNTMHGAALGRLFGPAGVAKATGYSYAVLLPFMVCSAPLTGLLVERTGGYAIPFIDCALALLLPALLFVLLAIRMRGRE